MENFTKLVFVLAAALMLGACGTKAVELDSTAVLEKYQSISDLKQMLSKAEKSGTAYLAPTGFEQARETYKEAFDMATVQEEGASELAKTGIRNLQSAINNAETSKVVLREVLDARNKTISAGAQTVYPKQFAKIESRLKKATEAIENNDTEEAKELRAELIKDYADLELSSLMTSTTQQAKAKLAEAEKNDADDYAPKTFKLAQEELALALDVLTAGRTQTQKAREHAKLSVYYSNKSMQITDLVVDFEQRDFSNEDTVLWYQDQLEIINKPFNQSLALDQPNYDVVTGMQGKISSVFEQMEQKQDALVSANENIAMLEGRVESIDTKHKLDKDANRKAEARFKRIQNMFTEDEAYVFRQGNNVLLETHAFNFKVGGSEIDSRNYDLLEKIMDAIKVFDNPDIMIMGHTDSTGGDAINLQLSQKRAQTVTAFLKKIGKLASNKVSTKGFGESRPVASNETKEGRERNRRIEVLIINK